MNITGDVVRKIHEEFDSEKDQDEVKNFLIGIKNKTWNVGPDQLIRSILYLLEGDVKNISQFQNISDPRDILQHAEDKLGNPGDYFLKPFE